MCEHYNIPYVQTQMIPMYIDWLRGLPPTDQAIMFEGKDMIGDRNEYPGDAVEDEESLLKILIEHDDIINHNNFIGWPISKKLGGYNLSLETIGLQGSPYVISEYDGHPNEEGHKRLAKAIYKHIKEK
jgi:hypothetical protein